MIHHVIDAPWTARMRRIATAALGTSALIFIAAAAQGQAPPPTAAPAPTAALAPHTATAAPGTETPALTIPAGPSTAPSRSGPVDLPDAGTPPPPPGDVWEPPHYDQGFVLVSSPDAARTPYRLKINHVSQFRYTNTANVDETYVDHLGRTKEVNRRNDVQLTRDVFYFSGYVFDRRLDFNILLYTSSATLSATAAGYVGFVFHKAFALRAGFFSLPSVRSLTGTYPFFHSVDRSMANNYMRPGFTQGVWANGEIFPGFNYIAMLGNSLNTLDVAAVRIDRKFAGSGSIWYDANDFGKAWNDFEYHDSPALRVGTAFTYAPEDRLSDLSVSSPENNSTFISDGTLLFETGSLAPNVTVQLMNFYLWAIDAGLKYRGLAFNTEFYLRWLNHFVADGPLPLSSMFDWGFEASLGYFVFTKALEIYGRSSLIRGPFQTAVEAAPGFNWYPFDTRNVWLSSEVVFIRHSPYQSSLYVYASGQTGILIPVQFLLRF